MVPDNLPGGSTTDTSIEVFGAVVDSGAENIGALLNTTSVMDNGDGSRIFTSYYQCPRTQRVIKRTQHVRSTKATKIVKQAVAERQRLRRYGSGVAAGNAGSEAVVTRDADICLVLTVPEDRTKKFAPAVEVLQVSGPAITCRRCQQDHFTSQCPYKALIDEEKRTTAEPVAVEKSADAKEDAVKYVAPHARGNPGAVADAEEEEEDADEAKRTIVILNISEDLLEEEIREICKECGLQPMRVSLHRDRKTGRSRGRCFVSLPTAALAKEAVEELHGYHEEYMVWTVVLNTEYSKNPRGY